MIRTWPDSDVTPEYCAKHNWLIGSPETVAEKLERDLSRGGRLRRAAGVRLRLCRTIREAWHNSLRLLAEEVATAGRASDDPS